jgi:hypothetical protein
MSRGPESEDLIIETFGKAKRDRPVVPSISKPANIEVRTLACKDTEVLIATAARVTHLVRKRVLTILSLVGPSPNQRNARKAMLASSKTDVGTITTIK